MIIVLDYSLQSINPLWVNILYRVGGKQPTTRHMFYLQKTELGHFNLYPSPGLLQGGKPRTLAGLSWQFIIGQQSALNCTQWVPVFDLNKNILPNGWSMPCSDCLLVVIMAICHVCCYYTEGSGKPVVNILIEKLLLDVNVTTMQWMHVFARENYCIGRMQQVPWRQS